MTTTHLDAAPVIRASGRLAGHMQHVLVDLIGLQLQGKQAHWNVVRSNYRDLYLRLDEIVDTACEFSDQVAERMRCGHAGRAVGHRRRSDQPDRPARR